MCVKYSSLNINVRRQLCWQQCSAPVAAVTTAFHSLWCL